ncbi:beta-fructosidase precursor [Lactiplantibacillus xiangfangensis]|uniref:Beta-fructosidase n=2 Tax=Lactiplantibacillus xiangfangensis TaxID=942150 RepID=A0A0R2MD51_9LACO|nr:BspA family leucine-rich repeat surface protein [Lactiplantibacillus xiangfangensis]KRO11601.1 beta-fructosidase precursor [Lactiplantibacillus xiangfangensis]
MGKNNQGLFQSDQVTHYKMYKKGRYWLFAGIVLATMWQGSLLVQADEVNPAENGTVSQVTPGAVSTEKPTVTLKEEPGSQASNENVTAAISDQDQLHKTVSQSEHQADQDTSQAPKPQDPSSATPVKSELKVESPVAEIGEQSPDKVVEPKQQDAENGQPEVPAQEQSAGPTNPARSNSEEPATPTADGQRPNEVVEEETKGAATGQSEAPMQEQPAESMTTEELSSTVSGATNELLVPVDNLTDAGGMMASMLRTSKASRSLMDAAEPVVTEVATGNVWGGTSQWTLNSDGELHIGAGTFGTSPGDVTLRPWEGYTSQVKSVIFDGPSVAEKSLYGLFNGLANATTFTHLDYLDTEKVTDMSYVFQQDVALKTLDLSGWDVRHVTNMDYMFNGNQELTSLNVANWDTSSLVSAQGTFRYLWKLKSLDVSKWDTSKLQDLGGMFSGSSITDLDVSSWDTSSFTNVMSMFNGTENLTNLDVSNWNTSNVTTMEMMFSGSGVKNLDLHKWDVRNVQKVIKMFGYTSMDTLNISGWNLDAVTDLPKLFGDNPYTETYSGVVNLNASNLKFNKNITSLASLFTHLTSLKTINISGWDLSNITDLTDLLANDTALETIIADNWDLSNFKEIKPLFSGLDNLTTVSAQNWNLPQLTDLMGLFSGYQKLANVDASGWQIDHVTSYKDMFSNLPNLTDVNVSDWQTSQVTDMSNMFANDGSLSTLDLSSFDTSSVTTLADMLAGTDQLSKLVLGAKTRLTVNGTSVNLPAIVADPDVYKGNTGYWINSKYDQFTSKDLLNLTDPAVLADTFVWQKNLKSLTVKDSVLDQTVPNQWQPADNLVAGTDLNGQTLLLSKVTSIGTVDTTTPKTYTVTYQYSDAVGQPVTATATIQVIASKVAVTAHDTTLTQNQKWTARDSLDGALEFDGQPADPERVVVIDADKVDLTTPGTYTVTYQYTDVNGNQAQKQITVTVVKSKVGIDAKDATIVQGQSWTAQDSFVQAQTFDGQLMTDFSQVTVVGADKVDTKTPGIYQVTYSYTDIYGNVATKTITVTVMKSQVGIDAKDATIVQGQSWTAQDSFVQAQTFDGQPMTDFSQVTVVGADKVDTKIPGTYQVTYRYTDIYGNVATKKITVTVIKSQVGISVKDTTLVQGQSWTAQDSFVQSETFDGQPMTDFNQVTVVDADKVDTKKPGAYQVTYRYADIYGNVATKTITVTVVKSQVGVVAHDTTIVQGQKWAAEDSFDRAVTFDGQHVTDFNQVTVIDADKVDTKTLGTYQVTYRYTDIYGNVATQTINITVKTSQSSLSVKDAVVKQGETWTPADSFISAADATGQAVGLDYITVTGADLVDTSKPGSYAVSYRYTDAFGNQVAKTVTITVVADNSTGDGDNGGTPTEPDDNHNGDGGNGETPTEPDDNHDGDGNNGETPTEPDNSHDGDSDNGGSTTEPGNSGTDGDSTDHPSTSGDQSNDSRQKQMNPITTVVVADGMQSKPQPVPLTKQAPVNTTAELPKTSENTTSYAAITGTIMMGMLGLAGFFGKHRHEEP